jgi:hypothetical protein
MEIECSILDQSDVNKQDYKNKKTQKSNCEQKHTTFVYEPIDRHIFALLVGCVRFETIAAENGVLAADNANVDRIGEADRAEHVFVVLRNDQR